MSGALEDIEAGLDEARDSLSELGLGDSGSKHVRYMHDSPFFLYRKKSKPCTKRI
jgi:hypothetical protein